VSEFPGPIICEKDYNNLQDLKDKLSGINDEIKRLANPFENIGNSIFMSRAAVKLANIDSVYQINAHLGNIYAPQSDGRFSFCDIAGGPGAFSEYLFWRFPEAYGYGITLREARGLEWDPKLIKSPRFEPVWGEDDSGNLFTQWEFFERRIKENYSDGVDLAVADGGFGLTGKNLRRKEFLSSRLITVEFYLGFACIREGGSFVCKVFDTVTEYMYHITYILSLAFDEIIMFKPVSSRPANEERYLVCKGRRRDIKVPSDLFKQIIGEFSDENFLSSIVPEKIGLPNDYLAWMDEQNRLSIHRQTYYVNEIIEVSRGKKIELLYNINKALLLWDLPGNIEKSSRKLVKTKTKTKNKVSIDYDRSDLYLYDDVKSFLASKDSSEFPYKSLYYEDSDVIEMFKSLKLYNWRSNVYFFNKNNQYMIRNINKPFQDLKYKRSEEHTSELQSPVPISYAVFC